MKTILPEYISWILFRKVSDDGFQISDFKFQIKKKLLRNGELFFSEKDLFFLIKTYLKKKPFKATEAFPLNPIATEILFLFLFQKKKKIEV